MFMPDKETPCLDKTDLFFSDVLMDIKDAKKLCAGCDYKMECTEAGLDEDYGVWGGLSMYERDRLRRTRRAGMRIS